MKNLLILLSLAWMAAPSAFANPQTCTIFYRGANRHIESPGQWQAKVFFDQAVQGDSSCPGLTLANYHVYRVTLNALSQYGSGQAYVATTDRALSQATTVGGDPQRFQSETGFERVVIANAEPNFRGPLNLVMYGSFLVDTIVIDFDDGQSAPVPPPLPPGPPAPPAPPFPHPHPPVPPPHREERVFIGSFDTGNPFKWDKDGIANRAPGFYWAVDFELARGVDVEIGDVKVLCRGGQECYRQGSSGLVRERRPIRLSLPRPMPVESIQVESRPSGGLSFPSPKVNVYLVR